MAATVHGTVTFGAPENSPTMPSFTTFCANAYPLARANARPRLNKRKSVIFERLSSSAKCQIAKAVEIEGDPGGDHSTGGGGRGKACPVGDRNHQGGRPRCSGESLVVDYPGQQTWHSGRTHKMAGHSSSHYKRRRSFSRNAQPLPNSTVDYPTRKPSHRRGRKQNVTAGNAGSVIRKRRTTSLVFRPGRHEKGRSNVTSKKRAQYDEVNGAIMGCEMANWVRFHSGLTQ